jgi:hypothetical protein
LKVTLRCGLEGMGWLVVGGWAMEDISGVLSVAEDADAMARWQGG